MAAEEMQYLGPQALEFFIKLVQAGGTNIQRGEAIKAIGQMHYLGTRASSAVPGPHECSGKHE